MESCPSPLPAPVLTWGPRREHLEMDVHTDHMGRVGGRPLGEPEEGRSPGLSAVPPGFPWSRRPEL